MARSREDAGTAGALTLQVLGDIDHFRGSTLAQMLDCIGGSVSDRGDIAIAWFPQGDGHPDEPCINRSADANKLRLAEHFFHIFGYPLAVDPLCYVGDIVQKSLSNGAHDGQVVQSPLRELRDNLVYQHLVDNRTRGNQIVDLRVPFIGGISPVCWIKCRSLEKRFAAQSEWARLATANELFIEAEQRLLTRFCETVHLDYGELDVLRDVQSDSIYVVDINPTPYPLTVGIESSEWIRAVRAMAARFKEVFLS